MIHKRSIGAAALAVALCLSLATWGAARIIETPG